MTQLIKKTVEKHYDFNWSEENMKNLTLDLVAQKILHLESGQEFTLKKLYLLSEWRSYTKASRLSVGRRFYNAISNEGLLKDSVEFMGKDFDNAAMYRKL